MAVNHHVTELTAEAEREICRALSAIRYGSVEISIQDSRIVQIERKEKLRIDPLPRELRKQAA